MEKQQSLKVYTVKELMSILSLSDISIKRLLKAGKLKGFKVNGRWRVSEEDLKAFIEEAKKTK
ncbi:MAG: helix-turn-helix domain-containing protein [Candidatus Micrarchaeaceae archaeon]